MLALLLSIVGSLAGTGVPTERTGSVQPPRPLAPAFAQAAQTYGVPAPLLLALSYVATRWNVLPWNAEKDGGVYGPMALYDTPTHQGTLQQAAQALGRSPRALRSDPTLNILGAAAVLAADAHTSAGWYDAVVRYSGLAWREPAQDLATAVFTVLAQGVQAPASDGEILRVPALGLSVARHPPARLLLPPLPALPADVPLPATVIPVGSGGFAHAARPQDGLSIALLVLHDTEADYPGTVRAFTQPGHCCAAHYLVDGESGLPRAYPALTQFIAAHDIAYHAGNYWYNQHAVGIEHVGFADRPASYYTQQLYDGSARLAGLLIARYHIPLDRAHLLGHGNVPAPAAAAMAGMHWDPGPAWDWPYDLARVRAAYAQWTGNAPLPPPSVPPAARRRRARIRTVTLYADRATAADIPAWSAVTYSNTTPVYADDHGRPAAQLVRGASDPRTWQSPTHVNAADFACDNLPAALQTAQEQWVADPRSDLRAQAEDGEAFVRQGQVRVGGVRWDAIAFNGVRGWIRDDATRDGWGVIVTFVGGAVPTTLYGAPERSRAATICRSSGADAARAGQAYVAQNVWHDPQGSRWYEIYYNHRLAWVPADEVATS